MKPTKNIVPTSNLNRKRIKLPNTPPVITTIGGAYGSDITTNKSLAKQYGIKTKGAK
jgi:hypothetical protein